MSERNQDLISPGRGGGGSDSSSAYRDEFFSTERESGTASVDEDSIAYTSTSSASISLFSSGSDYVSEDLLSPDKFTDGTLDGDTFFHDEGGLLEVDQHHSSTSSSSEFNQTTQVMRMHDFCVMLLETALYMKLPFCMHA